MVDRGARKRVVLVDQGVNSERALAGALLDDANVVVPMIDRYGIDLQHFVDEKSLRVVSAVKRLREAGVPIDHASIFAQSGSSAADVAQLIALGCRPFEIPGHAKQLIVSLARRQLKGALEEASDVETLRTALAQMLADLPSVGRDAPELQPLASLSDPPAEKDNKSALFKNGWLRKGGGAMLIAPSGVGKSVWTLQAAILWAMGKAAFGIEPVRPLVIAVIQAEDDNEEVAFFRNNIADGLVVDAGYDRAAVHAAMQSSVLLSEMVGAAGESFIERVGALLKARPDIDLLIVNPFQSYFGGDVAHNSEVTAFLRAGLDPLIKPGRVGVIFVNHTNKPPNAKERKGWGTDAFSAYIGAGGAELVNWARAVLALMPVENIPGLFRLVAGKRGQRLGWTDDTGARTTQRLIAHHEPPLVFWRDATAEETAAASGSVMPTMKTFDPVKDAELLADRLRESAMQAPALRDYAEETFGRDRGRKAYKWFAEHLKGFMLSSARAKHKGALFYGTQPDAEAAARNWDAEKGVL
jgi:hypothetical protein